MLVFFIIINDSETFIFIEILRFDEFFLIILILVIYGFFSFSSL